MNITYFFVALGFLLFCVCMLYYALMNHRNAKASNDWASVSGKIAELQLWGKRRINGEMVDSENLHIKYQYEVNGKKFTGRRVAFYTLHYPETVDFANRYPQGSRVSVFYNPQNSTESVIIPGRHTQKPKGEIWIAGIAVATLVATVIGIAVGEIK